MKEITVPARTPSLDEVVDFVGAELDKLGCSKKTYTQIIMAVEEIFVNISNYAYDKDIGIVHIFFDVQNSGKEISLTFTDDGKPYNPLQNPDPDISLSATKRNIGGLGIFLVKKIMTSAQYEYRKNQNILTIVKEF